MANRTYEVMYIIDPETAADKITKLNTAVGKLIEKEGGSIVRMDDIGRKPLAYPIQKKKEGHYVLFEIEGSGQEIAELERRIGLSVKAANYSDEDIKREAAAFETALKPGEDMVGLEKAFAAAEEDYRPGEAKKSKDEPRK